MIKIEELSLNAWPALNTTIYDGWIIRMANGYTKRANSINPLYKFHENFHEKLIYCEAFFEKYSLPTIFKITNLKEHEEIDYELEKKNYEKIDITSVQTIESIVPQKLNFTDFIIESNFSEDWIKNFIRLSRISDNYYETISQMLNLMRFEVIVVSKKINDESIGCAFGVIQDDFVGLFDLIIKESERNKGFANDIVKIILNKAFQKGIKKSYLQVVTSNIPAINLYNKLGFKEKYKYWYRKKSNKISHGV
jgi:GNAT superfamily N-acetyltransferase